jgi:energy-coupling factor transporter ATP-binding protein EcfA2
MIEHHTYLGDHESGYGAVPVTLTRAERFEHLGILGASGVGKSTLLRTIAAADIARGDGLLFIDAHGDDAEALLDLIPPWRHNHVAYIHPASEHVVPINILECDDPNDRARIADALVTAVRDIWFSSGDLSAAPRMENVFRHALLALLDVPNATLPMVSRLLTDDVFRLQVLPRVTNPITRAFFEDRFAEYREAFKAEVIEPLLTRLDTVLVFPEILYALGQFQRTLCLDDAMQSRRIIIANLSGLAETATHLLGALMLARVRSATLARARVPVSERVDFHVMADEAARYATNSLPSLLAEARKFAVSISYSTQMLAQLTERTRVALLSTTGTVAAFRCGPEDASVLAEKFGQLHRQFNAASLNELDRGVAYIKCGGDDVRRVLCPPPLAGFRTAELIRQQSRRHFARSRAEVQPWIHKLAGIARPNDTPKGVGKKHR